MTKEKSSVLAIRKNLSLILLCVLIVLCGCLTALTAINITQNRKIAEANTKQWEEAYKAEEKLENRINLLEQIGTEWVKTENMIDDATISNGVYINYKDGLVYDRPDLLYRGTADYIEIDSSKRYIFTTYNDGNGISFAYNALIGAYYDEDKQFISGIYSSGSTQIGCYIYEGSRILIVPKNAAYIRISVNDLKENLKWMLEDADESSGYEKRFGIKEEYIEKSSPLEGKVIVNFGDSIVGNTWDASSVSNQISRITGALVYNCGFGSCKMSIHEENWDACSMCRIADCINSGDFSSMEQAITAGWKGMPGYFTNTVRILAHEIDWNEVDLITISYGTNDYRSPGAVLDNPDDLWDTSTVCGALRYSIKQIQSRYPHIKILVTTPIYRRLIDEKDGTVIGDSDTTDWGSGTLIDYAEAMKDVCRDLKIPCLDLYNECQFNAYTSAYFFQENDGTHPNEKGREYMAVLIAKKILMML